MTGVEYSLAARHAHPPLNVEREIGARSVADFASTHGMTPSQADAFVRLVQVQRRIDTLVAYGLVERAPGVRVGGQEFRRTCAVLANELTDIAASLSDLPDAT